MIVSADTPPNFTTGGAYWERSLDPTHPEAFSGILVLSDEELATLPTRRSGWMLVDWIENCVGFIADGTECAGDAVAYELKVGPFRRVCAYPPGSPKLIEHDGVCWCRDVPDR